MRSCARSSIWGIVELFLFFFFGGGGEGGGVTVLGVCLGLRGSRGLRGLGVSGFT